MPSRFTTFYRENALVGAGFISLGLIYSRPFPGGHKALPYILVRLRRIHARGRQDLSVMSVYGAVKV